MVSGNFRRLRGDYFNSVEALSIRRLVPIIGIDEVRNVVGMGCALQIMDTSRIKGKWQDQLQWDSMCRTLTWYKNVWEAGAGSMKAGAIYSANDKNVY